ncbi:hypothetical protein TRFO_10368 [Tritrichomonas foetus]|uniref:Protein kinase domain-containing protein n=1 Tax=Tritrichomonas foetus TaxID=1144522 RepID=A0A1J4JAM2_9EUKA|nr:hypothetical protein TRFO_10368 [Tritrichomonas foetus]|eukprot:OHS95721.1 hypothetical protein TRFO_10368 [Tritrichomonas foetus]
MNRTKRTPLQELSSKQINSTSRGTKGNVIQKTTSQFTRAHPKTKKTEIHSDPLNSKKAIKKGEEKVLNDTQTENGEQPSIHSLSTAYNFYSKNKPQRICQPSDRKPLSRLTHNNPQINNNNTNNLNNTSNRAKNQVTHKNPTVSKFTNPKNNVLANATNSTATSVSSVNSSSSYSSIHSIEQFNESKIVTVNDQPYWILQKIGKGGSSKVYKVLSSDMAVYALKIVDLSQASQMAIESFINEVELLQKLQGSDRIVSLIDSEVNMNKQQLSIVLELGDIDLRSLIEKNREDDETVNPNFLRLMWQQMLESVQIVHDNSVVHGDLKPANFLFVKGTLKLIDFGIAKSINIDANTTNIERTNQVGTLNYMSPEALKRNEEKGTYKCGRAADVWSLGCILYQLIYHHPPFPQTDFFTIIQAIVDENYEIEFPPLDRPDFPALLDIMQSCLQRDPKARPTIAELLEHQYITMNNNEYEVQVSSKLLHFINFIQDYMGNFAHDPEIYDQVFDAMTEHFLDVNESDSSTLNKHLAMLLRKAQLSKKK